MPRDLSLPEVSEDNLDHRDNGRSDRRAAGLTDGAICVQRLDDSLNSAIHTRYRSSRRSSSMHEPRGPPLEVILFFKVLSYNTGNATFTHPKTGEKSGPQKSGPWNGQRRHSPREGAREGPPPRRGEVQRRIPSLMDSSRPQPGPGQPLLPLRAKPGRPHRLHTEPRRPSSSARRGTGARVRAPIGNDPSAGSPTETLLRLLLPLNDQV